VEAFSVGAMLFDADREKETDGRTDEEHDEDKSRFSQLLCECFPNRKWIINARFIPI
jgi:hypothetical protein